MLDSTEHLLLIWGIYKMSFLRLSIMSLLLCVGNVYAQEDTASKSSSEVEEITVTGSQN